MRSLFREGRGINSSVAVYQDVTGKAEEKVIALGVAIGSGYLYKTTFEKEVFSDLYGGKKVSKLILPICTVICVVRRASGPGLFLAHSLFFNVCYSARTCPQKLSADSEMCDRAWLLDGRYPWHVPRSIRGPPRARS